MSVKFKVIAKKNPLDAEADPKFYASAVSSGDINLRALVKEIAARSTVSAADTMAVIESLLEVIPQNLADGKIVRLGELGNFYLRIKSTGAETEAKCGKSNIEAVKLHFRAGKEFNTVLKLIDFEKVSS